MPWKASDGTEMIPLSLRSSWPLCAKQDPVRLSGEPRVSPLKVQLPNTTVQDAADALPHAVSSTVSKRVPFIFQEGSKKN